MKRKGRHNGVAGPGVIAAMSPNPRLLTGTGSGPIFPYISKDGKHAYVTYGTSGNIGMFSRDSTGALNPLNPASVACAYSPRTIAEWTDANGSFLYVPCSGGDVIRVFKRDTTTGLLTIVGSYATPSTPMGVVISSDGNFVYVSCKVTNGVAAVAQFSRNPSTGVLSTLTPSSITFGPSNTQAHGIVMVGTNVYVGTFGTLIYAFTQNSTSGLLSAAATPSYTAGTSPAWLTASPDGKNLYAVNDGSATISSYTINADGSLTALGSALPTGGGPWSVVVSPDGKHVYAGDSDAQTISMYSRDTTTGALTAKTPARIRSDMYVSAIVGSGGPQAICISPDGLNLYGTTTADVPAVQQFHTHI